MLNISLLINMAGYAQGGVRATLRLEGLAVCLASLWAYHQTGAGWVLFVWCFLLPDVALLGYFAGRKTGAVAYNLAHSFVGPLVCLSAGLAGHVEWRVAGLIWLAHIGFDRALGYGLKYERGFVYTHLGLIGAARFAQNSAEAKN